ncbi:hypothetical protein QQS21_009209 [Conoideocrella luteorostrata]|uniref:Uncharacterized protein n=1 Tax=Conoideocrella luteorostrata TaxID=1105319 RepID=A0AAJ0CHJ2_9HYPO|nr:hypothetical protein QQS21_009209 [Conoideocrella luteorostrata]
MLTKIRERMRLLLRHHGDEDETWRATGADYTMRQNETNCIKELRSQKSSRKITKHRHNTSKENAGKIPECSMGTGEQRGTPISNGGRRPSPHMDAEMHSNVNYPPSHSMTPKNRISKNAHTRTETQGQNALPCQTALRTDSHLGTDVQQTYPNASDAFGTNYTCAEIYGNESPVQIGDDESSIPRQLSTEEREAYTDYTIHNRTPVIEENIYPHVHTVYEPRRTRSIHFHEHFLHLQPIVDSHQSQ